MVDYFSLFEVPRVPALDAELLKQKYHELSSKFHPDKNDSSTSDDGTQRFAQINEGYKVLANPKTRVMHLLDLAGFAEKEKFQSIDPAIANLFSEVGKVLQKADKLSKERLSASSPMIKASLFGQGIELTDQLQQWQITVQARVESAEQGLAENQSVWQRAAGEGCDIPQGEKAKLYQKAVELGFLQRLQQQIAEKIAALSF